ncbi:MAG TPA: cysteine dioxygenase family protein [Acidimicrobiales bacterium]|nr:cysteine dioxygenase family protein [Acidimicrobiales bacterium]
MTLSGSPGLRHLVRHADDLVGGRLPGPRSGFENARQVAAVLADVLGDADLLPAELAAALPPDGFGKYLLFASPAFVVFATVTAPEVAAPIHDHGSWGVVGLWRGREEEVRYRLSAAGEGLAEAGRKGYAAGDVMIVEPPPDDVHQVFNTSGRPSVSVHLFAGDLVTSGFRVWAGPAAKARHTGPLAYDDQPALGTVGAR